MSIDLATITLGPPKGRLRSGDDRSVLAEENQLIARLRGLGLEVMSGGGMCAEEDQLACTPSLWREHLNHAVELGAPSILLNLRPGTRADDVASCVRYLERELDGPARLILYGRYRHPGPQTTTVLAAYARLLREGAAPRVVLGPPQEEAVPQEIYRHVDFDNARAAARPAARATLARLRRARFLSLGPLFDAAAGTHPSLDALSLRLGPDVVPLPPRLLDERTKIQAGSTPDPAPDPRICAAQAQDPSLDREDLARLFAMGDLIREFEGDGLVGHAGIEAPIWGLCWKHLVSGVSARESAQGGLALASRCDLDSLVMQFSLSQLDRELPRVGDAVRAPAPAIFVLVDGIAHRSLRVRSPGPLPVEHETALGRNSTWTLAALLRQGERYRTVAWELRLRENSKGGIWFETDSNPIFPSPHAALIPGAHGAAIAEFAQEAGLDFEIRSQASGTQRRG